eukprot:scaffold24807_cov53-Attheya_sp.AAC.1
MSHHFSTIMRLSSTIVFFMVAILQMRIIIIRGFQHGGSAAVSSVPLSLFGQRHGSRQRIRCLSSLASSNMGILLFSLQTWKGSEATISPSSIFSHVTDMVSHNVSLPNTDPEQPTSNPQDTDSRTKVSEDEDVWERARTLRATMGHDAAMLLYQSLLQQQQERYSNHGNRKLLLWPAALFLAASPLTPQRQDAACRASQKNDEARIKEFRHLLETCRYNHASIQATLFDKRSRVPCWGPVYITPVAASSSPIPVESLLGGDSDTGSTSPNLAEEAHIIIHARGLKCMVTLFLLGMVGESSRVVTTFPAFSNSIPKAVFFLIFDLCLNLLAVNTANSPKECDLGMAFVELENGTNEALVVPHVHLFPMDIPKLGRDMETKSLVLVTDMHPNVLSSTTVGTEDKGTVMYIGPDSIALPQHLLSAVSVSFLSRLRHDDAGEDDDEGRPIQILDMCTGSGVQALSMLAAMEQTHPTAKALCVDINARALSFVKFNALLNGFDDGRVQVLQGDLIQLQQAFTTQRSPHNISTTTTTLSHDAPKETQKFWHSLKQPHALFPKGCTSSNETIARPYDIILANPPFIPVPPDIEGANGETNTKEADGSVLFQTDDNARREISRRYGLFSSGGSDGENVLISVIQVASKLLAMKEGLLAIVSEYMNPPMPSTPSRDLKDDTNRNRSDVLNVCQKMQYWWEIASHCSAKGILLTNEFPLSALEYARRRANDASEWHSWEQHLIACNITTISPGLLFVRTEEEASGLDLHHSITPKTDKGSIWTPNNFKA